MPDLAHNPAVPRLGLGMFGPLLAAVVMRLAVSREGIIGTLGNGVRGDITWLHSLRLPCLLPFSS